MCVRVCGYVLVVCCVCVCVCACMCVCVCASVWLCVWCVVCVCACAYVRENTFLKNMTKWPPPGSPVTHQCSGGFLLAPGCFPPSPAPPVIGVHFHTFFIRYRHTTRRQEGTGNQLASWFLVALDDHSYLRKWVFILFFNGFVSMCVHVCVCVWVCACVSMSLRVCVSSGLPPLDTMALLSLLSYECELDFGCVFMFRKLARVHAVPGCQL
jgi:hypothetical protein